MRTTVPTGRRGWSSEQADWWTLSVCEAVCAPKIARSVDMICQVASVFIQCDDGVLTYKGCSSCKKAWRADDGQPCSCEGAVETSYWRSKLTLTDHTGQVTATCFDAFASVATFVEESAVPSNYEDEEQRQDLLLSIAAVPFTVRLGFDGDAYADRTRMIVRLISQTFDGPTGVKHPLRCELAFPSDCVGIPPCRLSDTAFNAGIGMATLRDSALESFRVFVKITDKAKGAKRSADGDTLKVTRSAVCMLQDSEAAKTVSIHQHAGLNEAARFLQIPQNGHVHAMVAWRDPTALTLLSLWQIQEADVPQFRQFFRREVDIFDETQGAGGKRETPKFESPLRIAKAASEMSSDSVKHAWGARAKLDFEEPSAESRAP